MPMAPAAQRPNRAVAAAVLLFVTACLGDQPPDLHGRDLFAGGPQQGLELLGVRPPAPAGGPPPRSTRKAPAPRGLVFAEDAPPSPAGGRRHPGAQPWTGAL